MFNDSSDDEPVAPQTKTNMRSLFASSAQDARHGSQSLAYEGKAQNQRLTTLAQQQPNGAANGAGVPPSPGQQQTAIAARGAVMAYRGEHSAGAAQVVVAVTPSGANVLMVDRERRPLTKVRIDDHLQLLPSADEPTYATLFDPNINMHWSLMFRSAVECQTFVASTLAVQHFMLLPDGPRAPYIDLVTPEDPEGAPPAHRVHKDSDVDLSFTVWLLEAVPNSAGCYTCGKNVEEVVAGAPRRVQLGQRSVMNGIEDGVVGLRAGASRLLFLTPKKTRVSGLGNPEVGPKDSVCVFVTVQTVHAPPPTPRASVDGGVLAIEPKRDDKPAVVPAQQPAPAASPTNDSALVQTLLLQTLQMQQQAIQQQQQPAPPPPPPPPPPQVVSDVVPVHVERSLDRINQQLSALYEKMDRLDIDKKIEANNDKLERIVKKAVGKMPVNDVDIEDLQGDKDQLLARIEAQKAKIEETTELYHQALHQLGRHKEEVAGLKSDLVLERETSHSAITEAKERRRLEVVEAAVKHRQELEKAHEKGMEEGRELGRNEGYDAGKIDALAAGGSRPVQELEDELRRRAQDIVALESRNTELEGKMYEERREAAEQLQTVQGLVERLEERERTKNKATLDQGHLLGKTLRKIMNNVYAQIETTVYAMERDSIDVQDALNIVMVAVKSETRMAIDHAKREAQERAVAPPHLAAEAPPDDAEPAPEEVHAAVAPPAEKSELMTRLEADIQQVLEEAKAREDAVRHEEEAQVEVHTGSAEGHQLQSLQEEADALKASRTADLERQIQATLRPPQFEEPAPAAAQDFVAPPAMFEYTPVAPTIPDDGTVGGTAPLTVPPPDAFATVPPPPVSDFNHSAAAAEAHGGRNPQDLVRPPVALSPGTGAVGDAEAPPPMFDDAGAHDAEVRYDPAREIDVYAIEETVEEALAVPALPDIDFATPPQAPQDPAVDPAADDGGYSGDGQDDSPDEAENTAVEDVPAVRPAVRPVPETSDSEAFAPPPRTAPLRATTAAPRAPPVPDTSDSEAFAAPPRAAPPRTAAAKAPQRTFPSDTESDALPPPRGMVAGRALPGKAAAPKPSVPAKSMFGYSESESEPAPRVAPVPLAKPAPKRTYNSSSEDTDAALPAARPVSAAGTAQTVAGAKRPAVRPKMSHAAPDDSDW